MDRPDTEAISDLGRSMKTIESLVVHRRATRERAGEMICGCFKAAVLRLGFQGSAIAARCNRPV